MYALVLEDTLVPEDALVLEDAMPRPKFLEDAHWVLDYALVLQDAQILVLDDVLVFEDFFVAYVGDRRSVAAPLQAATPYIQPENLARSSIIYFQSFLSLEFGVVFPWTGTKATNVSDIVRPRQARKTKTAQSHCSGFIFKRRIPVVQLTTCQKVVPHIMRDRQKDKSVAFAHSEHVSTVSPINSSTTSLGHPFDNTVTLRLLPGCSVQPLRPSENPSTPSAVSKKEITFNKKFPIILPFLADGILALALGVVPNLRVFFRVPGDSNSVSNLKLCIDCVMIQLGNLEGVDDPNFLTSLRELLEPLVPDEMYNDSEYITGSN
ncbi:hypothetical protein BDP27DRAFT_1356719 [Rhodocollybia butyracea]|uniref:Uncharacterized protein n=1 Tax=Rhodocollybia butyracea TaxID=206335 RepID=A0A9P5QA68_9AGAR|nr:hypothetical protein BDP27DRAFT_1356719 [Rhodocollybia butyracea]